MRVILLGNAGAGKGTMARFLAQNSTVPRLSLDEIAWNEGATRRPHDESARELRCFLNGNEQWIIEGCYSDLIEEALSRCTELRFLNPGIEVCVEHCRTRHWEPEKFSSPEEQQTTTERLPGLRERPDWTWCQSDVPRANRRLLVTTQRLSRLRGSMPGSGEG